VKKISLLASAAVGYVLGTRAGRERYEQIRSQADRLWRKPQVQSAVDDATGFAKSTASDLGSKAADVAGQAKDAASSKVSGSSDSGSSSSTGSTPGGTHGDPIDPQQS
jgi:hypothetical protein